MALRLSRICAATVLFAACSTPIAGDPLNVSNQTSIGVGLFVNGSHVAHLDPHGTLEIPPAALSPPPWHVEARTSADRVLLSLDVGPNPVRRTVLPNGGTSIAGAGIRAELSCGQIDIWIGPPFLGPVPGPGTPGDCDP
jgi:hypothetical protein